MKKAVLFVNLATLSVFGMYDNSIRNDINTKSVSIRRNMESTSSIQKRKNKESKKQFDVKLREFLVKSRMELAFEYKLDHLYISEIKRKIKLWKKLNDEGKTIFKYVLTTGIKPLKKELMAAKFKPIESYRLLKKHLRYLLNETKLMPNYELDYKGLKLWKIMAKHEMDLINAVKAGGEDQVKKLIDKCTDINCKDEQISIAKMNGEILLCILR